MQRARLNRIQKGLKVPLLIENPMDLFYLTGIEVSKGRLLLIQDEVILFLDGRYFEQAKKQTLVSVKKWDDFQSVQVREICFDSVFTSYQGYEDLKKNFPKIEWFPRPNLLRDVRAIKTSEEIDALKKAAKLTLQGIEHVKSLLKEGVSEEELAFQFELFVRKRGASKLSFNPVIAFGENSAYPHHRAGPSRLQKNQVVLVDAGAVVDHYCGDLTRIFYFGTPNPELKQLEKLVKKAQETAILRIQPGVRIHELDDLVRDVFKKANVNQLYTHSLGHGVGLEVHEYPVIRSSQKSDEVLKEGMVITIEPGLYQPILGGIRLEEMLVVTSNGSKSLLD